jgi:hypothetical protein
VAQQWEKLIFHQNPDFGTVCDWVGHLHTLAALSPWEQPLGSIK